MSIMYSVQPGGPLSGQIRVPGDKSISHRALMLGAIAEGVTHISGFLASQDTHATLNALRKMGASIEELSATQLMIRGVGMHGLTSPQQIIDCGNSGTSMRLLAGLLAGQGITAELTGDSSLSRRPMQRVAQPLTQMGALIETEPNGLPPLKIQACTHLHGITYTLPVASAQIKSALLLAGLYATGSITIVEPVPTRDHTERMLATFNYPIQTEDNKITLIGKNKLSATTMTIPADISSAVFFIVAASITPGSDLILLDVGVNPTRTGAIHILQTMGADISLQNKRMLGKEPVADIHVRYAPLHGIKIPSEWVSLVIDEFPALFIAAANAKGETILTDAEELRVKESDRIKVMAEGLARLGITAKPTPDGMHIQGGSYQGGTVHSHGDHRIAMAFTIAGIKAQGAIHIYDCDNIATSFPTFLELAQNCGIPVNDSQ